MLCEVEDAAYAGEWAVPASARSLIGYRCCLRHYGPRRCQTSVSFCGRRDTTVSLPALCDLHFGGNGSHVIGFGHATQLSTIKPKVHPKPCRREVNQHHPHGLRLGQRSKWRRYALHDSQKSGTTTPTALWHGKSRITDDCMRPIARIGAKTTRSDSSLDR